MKWAYGVTTVPQRRDLLLSQTLASLQQAGFDNPRLFLDGATNADAGWWEQNFNLEVTTHCPALGVHGNWITTLQALFIRDPDADRYAIFQDDLITYKNLRPYLEKTPYPSNGYCNLYLFPENQAYIPRIGETGCRETGWHKSNQRGLGAQALIFNREAVLVLLSSRIMAEHPLDCKIGKVRVDGTVLKAMAAAGWREYVHNPSLVQHTGHLCSTIGHNNKLAAWWRGEDFDALELLKERS